MSTVCEVLAGHVSPETAFVVDDYPYGFRLRCRIRYWLEFKKGTGVRFVSQTTNPKRGGAWNKPKASTYGRFGGAMFLDEKGHVHWSALTEYTDGAEVVAWLATYGAGLPPDARETAELWRASKVAYDEARAGGASMQDAAKASALVTAKALVAAKAAKASKPEYQPKTGAACDCKPGVYRDNCPKCEGTGMVIDFAAIRARRVP
jgi:hypothetical protein